MRRRFVLGASLLAILAAADAPRPAHAQVFPLGDGEFDATEARSVPLAPLTRAYIPEAVDLSAGFPRPGNQKDIGACVSWSTGYAVRSYYEFAASGGAASDQSRIVSPAYLHGLLFALGGGTCQNPQTNIFKALAVLSKHGAVTMSEFPTLPEANFCKQSMASDAQAARFKIEGSVTAAEPNNIHATGNLKSGLAAGSLDRMRMLISNGHPVLVSMLVGKTFMKLASGAVYTGSIHKRPGDFVDAVGGHAMVLTGYDDRRRAFRLLNSWGEEWSEGGYGWVDYDTMMSDARYALAMKVQQAPPKPSPGRPASPPSALAAKLDLRCAEINETTGPSGGGRLTGFVSRALDLEALSKVASSEGIDNQVVLRPWPVCEAMLTLREPLTRTSRPKIELVGSAQPLKVGERFSIKVTTPDVPSFLYLVYIEDDGTVVNLSPRRGPLRAQSEPGTTLVFGDGKEGRPSFKVTPPRGLDEGGKPRQKGDPERGHEALIAIAARAPIDELEELEKPDSPVYARVSAKPAPGGEAAKAPPDRLFLSALRDIVNRRASPETLPREVAAEILHLQISD